MKCEIPSSYEFLFEEKLEDLNAVGKVLAHKKTGARVALIANDDKNKVFSIGFRTPPVNSTGVAHIIEHSVLCGSRNFPAKDPFVELAKGSLNTFLNAMTYPDKTIYPVASMNDQDFKNLMHVYMDAVLYPNIYQRKEIFQQEGWHYELEQEDLELTINGVVYNEMKGAFSSPESQLFRLVQNSLFPDTTYGVESGGDPAFIPELSYKEFIEFHKNYYHPSNSYIYLYGDMDFEERLSWLDKEYLNQYDPLEVDSAVRLQKAFDAVREVKDFYSLSEGEEIRDNTYLSYSTVVGNSLDKELGLVFQVLDYVLLQAPGAPIKQALLDEGIGRDILGGFEDEILQPSFMIIAKNSEEAKKDQFIATIRRVLEDVVKKGLEEKSLRAAINFYEFKYREADYGQFPKGLLYGLRTMSSWLHNDTKPFLHLRDSAGYAFLKEKIGTGYYEKVIEEHLLNNTHASLVILQPKPGLNSQKEEELKKKLAAYKASLPKEEIQRIIEETKALKQYQEIPSTREDLEKIPLLTREDIGKEIEPLYNEAHSVEGVKVIHHNVYTNKIAYTRLMFNIKQVPGELLPYTSLLSLVLGYADTNNHTYLDLSNEVNIHTGGITTNVRSFSVKSTNTSLERSINSSPGMSSEQYYPVFEFSAKVLYDKLTEGFRLVEEIIGQTKLDDKKRLKEIVDEMKSKLQMNFNSSGHSVAIDRAMSYYSAHGLFKEITTGIEFYKFMEDLSENYQTKAEDAIAKMKELLAMIFTKENLMVSITADEEGYGRFEEKLPAFLNTLPAKADEKLFMSYNTESLKPVCLNEGFKTAMQVQYVARAGNYMRAGLEYSGALKVLKTILSYDYLWINVRVKGGAYGCMCGFSGVDGDAYFTSYRDPNLKETNHIYENAVEFVKNFDADERDITKYIIGTFSTLDTPLTPQGKGRRSLSMYLAGITEEDLRKEREQVRSVTVQDIREQHKVVKAVLDAGNICVIGNEEKINENRELFKEIKSLMKSNQ
ncbi:MAG TPA: insulinase family protein [Clostridiales bacterium]|nr:insulinase family protein [Clostridiales bacterium]